MRAMNRAYEQGITITGLLIGSMILVVIAVLGMKVVPDVIEYGKIVSNFKAVAQDPAYRQASSSEVRKAYERRALVDHISAIQPEDIEVTRMGNSVVLSVAYRKEIRLFGPVGLVIDFEASSGE